MPDRIDINKDSADKVYRYLEPVYIGQTDDSARESRQALLDWHGKVDPAMFSAFDFHVGTKMLYRLGEQVVARDWIQLVKKKPYLPFVARKEQYRGMTDALNEVLTFDLDRAHYPEKMEMAIRLMFLGGDVALFPFMRDDPVSVAIPYEGEDGEVEYVKDIRRRRHLDFKVIPSWLYATDPTSGYEFWDADWGMFREFTSLSRLNSLLKTLNLRKKIDSWDESALGDVGREVLDAVTTSGGMSENNACYIDHILCRDRYIRVVNGKEVIQDMKINPWVQGRVNLIVMKNITDPNPASTRGVGANHVAGEAMHQYETSFNALNDALMQRRNLIMTYNDDGSVKPEHLSASGMGPRIPRRNPDDVDIMRLPDLSQDFWQMPKMIRDEVFDIIGIQPYEMGALPRPVQQSTVVQTVSQASNEKIEFRFRSSYWRPLSQFALHLAVIAQRYKRMDELIPLLGERIFDIVIDPQDPTGSAVLDPRRIEGGYYVDFESFAKTAESQERLLSIEKLYNMSAQDPLYHPLSHVEMRKILWNSEPGLSKEDVDRVLAPTIQQVRQQQQTGINESQPLLPSGGGAAESVLGNHGQVIGKPGQPVAPFANQ